MRYLLRIFLALALALCAHDAFAVDQTDSIATINSTLATFSFTATEKTWLFSVPTGSKAAGRILSFRSLSGDWEWARTTAGPYNPVYANEQFNFPLQSDGDILYLRGLGGAGSGTIRGWVSK